MYYSAEILKRKMFLPKHLLWVFDVFSSHPGWEDFANRGLLPKNVKELIDELEFIHNDKPNLMKENPYKYLVQHGQRPWDEVVAEMLLCFLLNNDVVREAMLAYFNATSKWNAYLGAPYTLYASLTEVTKWENGSVALQRNVNEAHAVLDQVVVEALHTQLIQDCLSTVQKIVVDVENARVASLTLRNEQLTAAMDQYRNTRDTLVSQLQLQLEKIEAVIIAENPAQP